LFAGAYFMSEPKMRAKDMPDSFGPWKELLLSLELREKELKKQITLLSAPTKRAKKATKSQQPAVSETASEGD
jgi:hypothetical protein